MKVNKPTFILALLNRHGSSEFFWGYAAHNWGNASIRTRALPIMPAKMSVFEDLTLSCALFFRRADNYPHAALSYSRTTKIQVQETDKAIVNKKEGEI